MVVRSRPSEHRSLLEHLSSAPEVKVRGSRTRLCCRKRPLLNDQDYPSPAACGMASDAIQSDGQWGLRQIGAETAWNTRTTSENVVVAVIDLGVQANHPDFQKTSPVGSNVISTKSVINDRVRNDQRPAN